MAQTEASIRNPIPIQAILLPDPSSAQLQIALPHTHVSFGPTHNCTSQQYSTPSVDNCQNTVEDEILRRVRNRRQLTQPCRSMTLLRGLSGLCRHGVFEDNHQLCFESFRNGLKRVDTPISDAVMSDAESVHLGNSPPGHLSLLCPSRVGSALRFVHLPTRRSKRRVPNGSIVNWTIIQSVVGSETYRRILDGSFQEGATDECQSQDGCGSKDGRGISFILGMEWTFVFDLN